MALPGEIFALAIYVLQQAGVMLGVGAEVVVLLAYLFGLRVRQPEHDEYRSSAQFAQRFGLGVMVVSGVGAVVYHGALGQLGILLAPAFLFKWLLIALVMVLYRAERAAESMQALSQTIVRGLAGGTWLALFLVHSIAPATGWSTLLVLYAVWMLAFGVLWAAFVGVIHGAPLKLAAGKSARPEQPVVGQGIKPAIKTKPAAQPPEPAQAPTVAAALPPQPIVVQHAVAPQPAPLHVTPAPAPRFVAPRVAPAPAPKPAPHAPLVPPKPAYVAAAPAPMPPPAVPAAVLPAAAPTPPKIDELPAIRVMPRTPDDIASSNRAAVVQFTPA